MKFLKVFILFIISLSAYSASIDCSLYKNGEAIFSESKDLSYGSAFIFTPKYIDRLGSEIFFTMHTNEQTGILSYAYISASNPDIMTKEFEMNGSLSVLLGNDHGTDSFSFQCSRNL